jgi:hypothetical protein
VFVAQIVGAKAAADQRRIDAYNAAVPGIVVSKGRRVHLVDMTGVDGLDIRDNFHPNDFGYSKMAYSWLRAMEPVLNHSGTPWPTGTDPYEAQQAYRCLLTATYPQGRYVGVVECREWYRRALVRTVAGQRTVVHRWQTRRPLIRTYRSGGRLHTLTDWTWSDS